MDNQFKMWITDGMNGLNVDISDNQISQFFLYYNMLIERNKVMNLTAITDMRDVIYKHFVDSMSLIMAINVSRETSLIDVGTGAGFPGIPLKIMFPHLKITLLDSLHKRIKFLDDVISQLQLKEVNAIHERAEIIGRSESHREKYDICVSRAVANLATLSEYCIPFVKPGGSFISYKSGSVNEELTRAKKAINLLGGTIEKVVSFQIPEIDADRCLVRIGKTKKTPPNFPRKAGLPAKEPLG